MTGVNIQTVDCVQQTTRQRQKDRPCPLHTLYQLISDGRSSSPITTAITLRRSIADSSPSLSNLASPPAPAVPNVPPPDAVAPTPRPVPVINPAVTLLPPPPSQARNVAHLSWAGQDNADIQDNADADIYHSNLIVQSTRLGWRL